MFDLSQNKSRIPQPLGYSHTCRPQTKPRTVHPFKIIKTSKKSSIKIYPQTKPKNRVEIFSNRIMDKNQINKWRNSKQDLKEEHINQTKLWVLFSTANPSSTQPRTQIHHKPNNPPKTVAIPATWTQIRRESSPFVAELHHCKPPPRRPHLPLLEVFASLFVPARPHPSSEPCPTDRARREPFHVVTRSNLHRRE